jgi:hypothetical protein
MHENGGLYVEPRRIVQAVALFYVAYAVSSLLYRAVYALEQSARANTMTATSLHMITCKDCREAAHNDG